MTAGLTAARVFRTLIEDPERRATSTGVQETVLDSLVLAALREVPEVAASLFGLSGDVRREHMRHGVRNDECDILIYDPSQTTKEEGRPVVLLEVKGPDTNYNRQEVGERDLPPDMTWTAGTKHFVRALDAYHHAAREDAKCRVLMPRAKALGKRLQHHALDPNGDDSMGRRNLAKVHATADDWKIITFEEVSDSMAEHGVPIGKDSDPDVLLVATLLRARGFDW